MRTSEEEKNFLQFHMYFTQAQKKNDIKGLTLQLALDLLHKQVLCPSEIINYLFFDSF